MTQDAIEEYRHVVNTIYGVYLDATTGFFTIRQQLELHQVAMIERLKETHPEWATQEYMDGAWMAFGPDDPNDPTASPEHLTTQRQFKERNSPDAQNYQFIGNMALVAIYQFWEDNYRAKIATLFGKASKDDLLEQVMGELGYLRNSILHKSGLGNDDMKKCKLLPWFKENDAIYIDSAKLKIVILHIKDMLNRYRVLADFRRWFVTPIEVLNGLEGGDGGFVAMIAAMALYGRFIEAKLKLRDVEATDEEIGFEVERDLHLNPEQRAIFLETFRSGMLSQAMPKNGPAKWRFHDDYTEFPVFTTVGEQTEVHIHPMRFADRILREFQQEPKLIYSSQTHPWPTSTPSLPGLLAQF